MEIYDLSFNTLVSNLQDDCTVFFCPKRCRFIQTLDADLGISVSTDREPLGAENIQLGKVMNWSHITRVPSIFLSEPDVYCDITILTVDVNTLQVIIIRHKEFPEIQTVQHETDVYKVFYEYLGSISDLKTRTNFEYQFLRGIEGGGATLNEEVFCKAVEDKIIKKLFD